MNHNERVLHNPRTGRYAFEKSAIEGLPEEVIERDKSTVDEWRYLSMLKFADRFDDKDICSWLRVGDRMGHDAERLSEYEFSKVTLSSLSTAYLAAAKERGLQADFKSINAEMIELEDGEYGYLLCKEASHHMPLSYLVVYKMLRVARKAVVFIWLLDQDIDQKPELAPATIARQFVKDERFGNSGSYFIGNGSGLVAPYIDWIKDGSGNYVYTMSQREVKNLLKGTDCHSLQFKHLAIFIHQSTGLVKPCQELKDLTKQSADSFARPSLRCPLASQRHTSRRFCSSLRRPFQL